MPEGTRVRPLQPCTAPACLFGFLCPSRISPLRTRCAGTRSPVEQRADSAHNGGMRRFLTTVLALVLLGSSAPQPAAATTTKAKSSLTIAIDLGVGQWERWTVGCSPVKGTHKTKTISVMVDA